MSNKAHLVKSDKVADKIDMEIKVLSPLWGHEQLEYRTFLDKMRVAG